MDSKELSPMVRVARGIKRAAPRSAHPRVEPASAPRLLCTHRPATDPHLVAARADAASMRVELREHMPGVIGDIVAAYVGPRVPSFALIREFAGGWLETPVAGSGMASLVWRGSSHAVPATQLGQLVRRPQPGDEEESGELDTLLLIYGVPSPLAGLSWAGRAPVFEGQATLYSTDEVDSLFLTAPLRPARVLSVAAIGALELPASVLLSVAPHACNLFTAPRVPIELRQVRIEKAMGRPRATLEFACEIDLDAHPMALLQEWDDIGWPVRIGAPHELLYRCTLVKPGRCLFEHDHVVVARSVYEDKRASHAVELQDLAPGPLWIGEDEVIFRAASRKDSTGHYWMIVDRQDGFVEFAAPWRTKWSHAPGWSRYLVPWGVPVTLQPPVRRG